MKKIFLKNESLSAVVLPDFGGCVSSLCVGGTEVLRLNPDMLGANNVEAGGIPVLFPFVSRTPDDEAEFEGKTYTMPMHGFAKEMPFDVAQVTENGCTLVLTSDSCTRRFYPYDFRFSISYTLEGSSLVTTVKTENLSNIDMPFVIGFHPYFYTPDRSATRFSFGLKRFDDYMRIGADGKPFRGELTGGLSLNDEHDTVFWDGDPTCEITDTNVGYYAKISGDESFDVVTICTMLPNASCIEPWQARPGAARDRSMCHILKPAASETCSYSIDLARV